MDLKHLLSLYIAELEAAGDQSREELLHKNPDLSGELNRFFRFMDQAKTQWTDATIDISSKAESDPAFEIGETVHHHSGSEPSAASACSDPSLMEDVPLLRNAVSATIGNYKLLQKIAEGGMGAVWLAEQQRPVRRRVALKLIKAGRDTDQIIARFDAERQALAMMEHQNIAKMLDAGQTDDGMPFFVMELVQGLSITQYCDRNRLTLQERLELFIPVCRAIQHAHQKGIIHRDLKPSNVLVTLVDSKPVPKVIDFGLAKATEHQTRLTDKTMFTEFGQVLGTLQYMSPEQAELNSLDVDTRTDIYALGVLLYELLTGSTPLEHSSFVNVSILKVLETIRTQEPPRPSSRLSGSGEAVVGISQQRRITPDKLQGILKGDLDWVVMKALEKDRTRRYETASAFADDIQRYLNNEPLHARPPSTVYLMQKFVRKHRPAVIAAAGMLGLLVFGLTGTAIGLSRALAANARETQARRVAESNLDRAVQAEVAERERSAELRRRSDELEKVSQFQQNQIRGIDPSKMGRELRARLIKELTPESDGNPVNSASGKPGRDLAAIDFSTSGLNFTDVATESLRSNIFLPAFESIKKDYADQPAFQAKMLLTMSASMRYAGIFDAAPIELCVAIRQQLTGLDSADTLEAKLELAHLLSDQGELSAGEMLYRETLEACRRILGNDHRLTQNALGAYAEALNTLGRFAESESLQRESIALRKRLCGADSPEVMTAMIGLALALANLDKLDEAESLHREVLAMRIAKYGEKSLEVSHCKLGLGKVLYQQDKYEEAMKLDEEVLADYREKFGDLHPDTLKVKNNLAADYVVLGRLELALELYRTVLANLQETLGVNHPQTLMAASNTAICLCQLGQFEESEALFQDTIERQDRHLGPAHPRSLKTVYDLAAQYYDNGQFEQATPWFQRYVDATADHRAACILLRCFLKQDKDKAAEQLLAVMLQREREKYANRPNELAVALGEMAQSFYECERFYVIRPILLEAQRLFIETKDRTSDAAQDVETMLALFNKE